MGIQQDIEQSLKGHHVDRIEGKPTEDAITRLVQQLSAMGAKRLNVARRWKPKALIDIINALQGAKKPDDNDKRFEDFMKATTDTLKALTDKMAKMGHSNNSNSSNHSGGGKKMKCKHCNLNHPKVAEKDCWTLESNKDKRPNWFKPKERKEE